MMPEEIPPFKPDALLRISHELNEFSFNLWLKPDVSASSFVFFSQLDHTMVAKWWVLSYLIMEGAVIFDYVNESGTVNESVETPLINLLDGS